MVHKYEPGRSPSKHDKKLSDHWFEFGTHPSGNVDIADSDGDIIVDIPKEIAEELITLRWEFIDRVAVILSREPALK